MHFSLLLPLTAVPVTSHCRLSFIVQSDHHWLAFIVQSDHHWLAFTIQSDHRSTTASTRLAVRLPQHQKGEEEADRAKASSFRSFFPK
ncbi:hypothetical protein L1987_19009 [Smallanthus sonchifolius]|uniref:Uncharacterized protein n=1 Tax=Smallanthus sonchifolius TaxID=185202 RepID=A0ACB9J1S9_9ASTR|nr:hypothetical protein L1987_19009 [Smallanthus sonchifolius]